MKLFLCVLAGLTLLAMALTLHVTWRGRPSPDRTSSVVIVRGPHGEPVECVCVGGTISTFDPDP